MIRLGMFLSALGGSLLLLQLGSLPLAAAVYYVSPTGDAAWADCESINTPCSWQTAMANAVAGDTVYFRGGVYDLGLFGRHPSMWWTKMYPLNSGTAGNPITFITYPGETPNITGTVDADSQETWFGCRDSSYITWDGFSATLKVNQGSYETAIVGAYSGVSCTIRNMTFAGINIGSRPYNTSFVRLENASDAVIENNYFHDLEGNVNTTAIWIFGGNNSFDNHLRNNTIVNTTNGILQKLGPNIRNLIYKNFIYNMYQSGVRLNNQSSDGGDVRVYQNVIVDTYAGSSYCGINIDGVSDTMTTDNYLIYNNTLYGSGCGIAENAYGRGHQFWNNIIMNDNNPFLRYYTGDVLPTYSNYNNFYHPSSLLWNLNYATNYTSLNSWQSATGFDSNSTTTNPNFIDPGGANPADYKRTFYPANGRGGAYASVMGAYITGDEIIGYRAPVNVVTGRPPAAPVGLRLQ